MGTVNGRINTASAALVDIAEPIDDKVVTKIIHANALGEPGVDVTHLLCCLTFAVVIAGHHMVHEGHLDGVGIGGGPTSQRLICTPLGPGDDGGFCCRCSGRINRNRPGAQPAVLFGDRIIDHGELGVCWYAAIRGVDADLNPVGAIGCQRLSGVSDRFCLRRARIRPVLAQGKLGPIAPAVLLLDPNHNPGLWIKGISRGDSHQSERVGRRLRGYRGRNKTFRGRPDRTVSLSVSTVSFATVIVGVVMNRAVGIANDGHDIP